MCLKVIGGGCVGKGEGGGLTAVLSDSLTLPPVRSGLPNLSNERMPNPNDWPALGGSICCGMRTWEWRSENGPGDTMSVRSSTIRAPLSVGGARSSTLAPARSGLAGSPAWFSAQSSSQYVPALVSSCVLNVQRPVRCSPVNGSVSGGVGNSQPPAPLTSDRNDSPRPLNHWQLLQLLPPVLLPPVLLPLPPVLLPLPLAAQPSSSEAR